MEALHDHDSKQKSKVSIRARILSGLELTTDNSHLSTHLPSQGNHGPLHTNVQLPQSGAAN